MGKVLLFYIFLALGFSQITVAQTAINSSENPVQKIERYQEVLERRDDPQLSQYQRRPEVERPQRLIPQAIDLFRRQAVICHHRSGEVKIRPPF